MIEDFLTRIRSILTFSLAIVYLSNLFIQSVWINHLTLVLIVFVIVLSLMVATGSSKIIGYISIILSIFILVTYNAPFSIWEQAIGANLYLVVMFTLVPLLKIPIQYGGYFEALQGFFRRFVNTNSRFYILVSFISAFVGILVNLAVVPLVHEISKASNLSANKKILSKAITRGFATCTMWSPTMASIALIIHLTGATWYLFFPFAFLSGVIAGMIGYVITMIEERSSKGENFDVVQETVPVFESSINYRKVIELCVFGIILITSIAIISLYTGIQTIVVVSIAALIFPILWLAILSRLLILWREFKGDYFHKSLPGLKNEVILFVGAGLFASSITYSQLGDYVPQILSWFVGNNIILFSIFIIVLGLIVSAIGIHPIVTITIIAGTVKASSYGVTPTYLAVLLAITWAMGVTISPSSATIITASGLVERSPIQVGPLWNGKYALVTSALLILIITIFRWLQLL